MSIADDLVAAIGPWRTNELEDYVRTIGEMFAETELYAFDTEDGEDGWSILFDPDRIPAKGLPFLAALAGEKLPVGITESAAREWIKNRPNMRRGTLPSLVAVAQRTLTGSRIVAIRERDGDEDHIAMRTLVEQTPDPARVRRELLADTMPADIVLDYATFTGAVWGDVEAGYATWADVMSANATWAEVAATLIGYVLYSAVTP